MRNRHKEQPIIEDVLIEDIGAEGKAIAHIDGLVVFVPFVVPGDVADIKILKKKKNYAEGRAVAIKQLSSQRVPTQCPHFGVCGGCKWQNLNYEAQIAAKQKQVKDNLERLGHIDCSTMQPICGSEEIFFYRNKLEYTFSTREWKTDPVPADTQEEQPGALGFHIPTVFDKVLNIEHCALQADPSNAIRLTIRDYACEHQLSFYDIRNHVGFLRNLVIRNSTTGDLMVVMIVAEDNPTLLMPLLEHVHNKFPEITSLLYIINNKMNDSYGDLDVHTYYGKDHIVEEMPYHHGEKQLHFKVGPKSFYQTNSRQAYKLYSYVADFADLQGDEVVYDLYTGTGTIAQFVASECKRVVGIEYVEEAIADAHENARYNQLDNLTFYAGDMAKVLTEEFVERNGRPDVVITDPPRAGMHEKVVEQLLNAAPQKIVYVSCNPATQARDLEMLCARYQVQRIQPVDMFPHTQHVENVVLLTKIQ